MWNLFLSIVGYITLDRVCIDNYVFRLHYKVTSIILVCFSVIVTSEQYFGNPIECDCDEYSIETYCWIHSTFTIPDRIRDIDKDIAPGIVNESEGTKQYYPYYQWVCFILFFQGLLFYTPRFIWKHWEGGRMNCITWNLRNLDLSDKADSIELLVDYITGNLGNHNVYASCFFLCELLNFVNVIVQIYFMDYFLDGQFSTYGSNVLLFLIVNYADRDDPMARAFPKITKCTFHHYGPSGTVMKLDILCLLPLNNANEKIYVFLWFWFMLLLIITGLAIAYRLVLVMYPYLRIYLIFGRSKLHNRNHIYTLDKYCCFGDWFILDQVSKNVESSVYNDMVFDLIHRFSNKNP